MNPRTVTAIVVTYNSGRFVDRILEDLLAMDHVDRVVVVDNNSSDDSTARVRSRIVGEKITLIESASNVGFGAAVNRAVHEECQHSEFIAVVNPDVGLGTDVFDRLLDQFDDDRLGVIGVQLARSDGTPVSSARFFPSRSTILRRTAVEVEHGGRTISVDWLCGAFMLWRADAFREVHGFSSDYFLYYEDVDICRRARELGWDVVIAGSVSAVHDQGHGAKTSPVLLRANRRSRRRYARRWLGKSGWAAALAADVLEQAGTTLRRIGLRR